MPTLAWDSVRKEILNDKLWRKVINGERITVAKLGLSKGCAVPVHQHENEQISLILEGALKVEIDGRELTVRAGEVMVIPSGVPHGVQAVEDTVAVDVFSPVRQDWIQGTDTYLRK